MACGANRNLFTIERLENGVKPYGFLSSCLPNVADMMHFYLLDAVADTARHAQFGAGSHGDTPLETIHLFLPNLETVSLLFPITVGVEDNVAVSLSIFCLKNDGWDFAET